MNINKTYVAFAGTFVGGLAIGFGACRSLLEAKIREEMELQVSIIENSYEAAIALRDATDHLKNEEGPIHTEVHIQDANPDAPDYIGEAIKVTPAAQEPVKNQYHEAVETVATPVDQFVDGGVNDYGVSYIEDEDYLDEDGRAKTRIDIIMNGEEPTFLMDGEQIDDWDKRLGDSILVDFYRLVPPGAEPVLYVRNHRTDEDYEVVRVTP